MSAVEHEPFHRGELAAQQRWRTTDLWDTARKDRLLWNHIPEHLRARIEAAPFFFLATSAPDGSCDCSFKGGGPGLIRVLDPRRFAFPDFGDGARLRVNGRASIHEDGPLLDLFPQRPRVVLVDIEQVVPNCARNVPRLQPPA